MHELESIISALRIVMPLWCEVFPGASIRVSSIKGCHSPSSHLTVTAKLRTLWPDVPVLATSPYIRRPQGIPDYSHRPDLEGNIRFRFVLGPPTALMYQSGRLGGTRSKTARKDLKPADEGRFDQICLEVVSDITGLYNSHASDSEQCSLACCRAVGCTRDGSVRLSKKLFQFKLRQLYPTLSPLAVAGEVDISLNTTAHGTILMVDITARISQTGDLRERTRAEGIIFRAYTAVIHQGRTGQYISSAHDWMTSQANPTPSDQSTLRASTSILTTDGQLLSYPVHTANAPFLSLVKSALTNQPITPAQAAVPSFADFWEEVCTVSCPPTTEGIIGTSRNVDDGTSSIGTP